MAGGSHNGQARATPSSGVHRFQYLSRAALEEYRAQSPADQLGVIRQSICLRCHNR
jgi:hypothetical protein